MIVKVCKKHGELTIDNTYQVKTQYGIIILMCSICKKGYRRDWAKLNPEKVKLREERKKLIRIEEFKSGTIKKKCKRHGDIPIEKMRIDTRGTIVCKLCDAENAAKLRDKDNELHLKKCKEWRKKNPDKMKKYGENYKKRRKVTSKALYQRWMKDPVQKEKIGAWKKKSQHKAVKEMSDAYVRSLAKTYRVGGKKNRHYEYLKIDIPQEIIELRRMQLKINRELRKQRKLKNGN
jgi:hypothetical protein